MNTLVTLIGDRRVSLFLLIGGALLFGATLAVFLEHERDERATSATPAAVSLVPALPTPVAPPGVNMVANASFEDGPSGWQAVGLAGSPGVALDATVRHNGTYSVRLDRTQAGTCGALCGYWTSLPLNVVPGRNYQLKVWFKVSPSLVGASGLYATIRVPDASGAFVPRAGTPKMAIDAEWTELSLASWAADSSTAVLDLAWLNQLAPDDPEGQVWIDDVLFTLLP